MTLPQISIGARGAAQADVVFTLLAAGDEPSPLTDTPVPAAAFAALGATGAHEQVVQAWADGGSHVLVGVGAEPDDDAIRTAIGAAVRRRTAGGVVRIDVPDGRLGVIAEGALLGAYDFSRYRGTASSERTPVEAIVLGVGAPSDEDAAALDRAVVVAEAVALVKDLANTPGLDAPPAAVADAAAAAVAGLPVEIDVLDERRLAEEGYGGIVGVGQGSSRPPRLVRLDYAPAGAEAHLAVVGKGITFDTGGLSLKPAASMLGMKYDMAGAASVLGLVVAAARLALPVRITGWLCLAENMPSGTAIRPGDVLTLKGGTTVEVTNTDAEGRLVLADGLVAASAERPDAIVDVATLTGAALVALGKRTIGAMGDDGLVARVRAAADAVGEPLWPMPLPRELKRNLSSEIADMVNAKVGSPHGGMLVAGHFLQAFIGEDADGKTIPWAHLDVAGPADNGDAAHGFTGVGATGVPVRTLLAFAQGLGGDVVGS